MLHMPTPMMNVAAAELEAVQSLPFMTANNAPSPHVVSATSDNGASQAAWVAFDSSGANTFWSTSDGITAATIQRDFPSALTVGAYAMTSRNDGFENFTAGGWTAEYWNGSAWVQFDSRSSVTFSSGQRRLYTLPTPISGVLKIRYNMTPGPGGRNPSMANIEILQIR